MLHCCLQGPIFARLSRGRSSIVFGGQRFSLEQSNSLSFEQNRQAFPRGENAEN
jgi:hypothetical protein